MNYAVPSIAGQPEPRYGMSLKPPVVTPLEPEAEVSSLPVRGRRRALSRVLAAMSVRSHRQGPSSTGGQQRANGGVSPIANGATRGIAFLINR